MGFVGVLLLLSSLFASPIPGNDGPAGTYTCSEIISTNGGEEACKATMWCVWSSGVCKYDKCLKYVADTEDVATACDHVDETGWDCKLFYITDKHDCSDGSEIQSDRYCRTNISSNNRNPMSQCFYNDLKALAGTSPANQCPLPLCKMNETKASDWGKYCYQSGADVCNTVYGTNKPAFCDCLGVAGQCKLYPGCQTVQNACVEDPCYAFAAPPSGSGNCINVIPTSLASACGPQAVNVPSSNQAGAGYKCFNKSRTDINTCFDLQNITTTPGTQPYPECVNVVENDAVCGTGVVISTDGTPTTDPCQWVEIAGGFFSAANQHYCNDGKRSVPSPSGSDSGFIVKIPSMLALLTAVAFAFLG